MRLIGTIKEEKAAYTFCTFLLQQGIPCKFEPFVNKETKEKEVHVWIENEDDFARASEYFEQFQQDPHDPHFKVEELTFISPARLEYGVSKEKESRKAPFKIKIALKPRERLGLTLTTFIIGLCVFLFFLDSLQQAKVVEESGPMALEMGFTPLEQVMIFDYPCSYRYLGELLRCYPIKSLDEIKTLPDSEREMYQEAQAIPTWRGAYDLLLQWKKTGVSSFEQAPLFEKIRGGEVWRIFTPCLMHRGFLHILFNMAWVWILGRQIEERISKKKMIILFLATGIISNVLQYLMSGPFFLGFSGIVVGMAGFIWMRQKVAPWEGYPLQKPTIIFILIFVLAMFALELFSFLLQIFSTLELTANIANTAHIVGGIVGMMLGRLHYFARGKA